MRQLTPLNPRQRARVRGTIKGQGNNAEQDRRKINGNKWQGNTKSIGRD